MTTTSTQVSGSADLHRTAPTPPASVATGGDIPGATKAGRPRADPHLRWLREADHWGEWIRFPDDEPGEPERVWMMRGANGKVRFYALGQGQVGPEHGSVVAGSTWAWANRWLWLDEHGSLDMDAQLRCRDWVLAGGAARVSA